MWWVFTTVSADALMLKSKVGAYGPSPFYFRKTDCFQAYSGFQKSPW